MGMRETVRVISQELIWGPIFPREAYFSDAENIYFSPDIGGEAAYRSD
jgi:hypothetical protein